MTGSAGPAAAPDSSDEIASLRARLARAERRLAAGQRLARLGDWEVDLRSGLGRWSDELCGVYGVPPGRDDISFEAFLDIVHPEDRDVIRRMSETALSRGAACDVRYRIVRPDNVERLIQCRAEVEIDPAGTPLKIFGMAMDITEIGRLEETLRDSEQKYRLIIENAPVGVTLVDADRRYLMVNPAWERMTGYAASELTGLTPFDITHPEDVEGFRLFFDQVTRGGLERHMIEKRYVRKNGEVLWARVHVNVVRDLRGQHLFRLAIIQDITAEKEAARRQAETARQQRGALIQEVHHRIKNNLQGVSGLLERHAAANPALAPAIDEARTRLNALALAHGLESGLATAEVNLCSIVRGLVDMLQAESPAQIEFDLPVGFVPIEIAEEESVPVALILNELLTNALKHLEDEAVRPAVSVTLSNSSEGAVVVARNEPAHLPAGFDFDSGAGLGTGLKLAKSLLPAQGASLGFGEPSPGRVEAVLRLWPPMLRVPPLPKHGGGPM